MPRFIHTADWQIGRQYSQFDPDDAQALADARIEAVQRIAALAAEHRVDAVLVAGDVFDLQTVSERTIRRLFNATHAFGGAWIMIPGNHDAALRESVWTLAQRLGAVPANVRLSLQPELIDDFEALGFVVLTAPLTQRHTYTDLTAEFAQQVSAPGLVRIGLAHGSVQGVLAEGIDSSNPIAADSALRGRLDYLALGDWHGCKRIDARCWYSGTPETDRFKGNDPGHALLIEVAQRGAEPVVTRLAVGRYRWMQDSVALALPSDLDALVERLQAVDAHDVLRIAIDGHTDLAGRERLQSAIGQARARGRSVEVQLHALQLAPTADDLAALQADGYLASVIHVLQQRQQREDDGADTAALALALLAGVLREQSAPAGMSVAA